MLLGIALVFLVLWLLSFRLAASRPGVLEEAARRGGWRGDMPHPRVRLSEGDVPALVSTGSEILAATRRSAHWRTPGGTRLSMN